MAFWVFKWNRLSELCTKRFRDASLLEEIKQPDIQSDYVLQVVFSSSEFYFVCWENFKSIDFNLAVWVDIFVAIDLSHFLSTVSKLLPVAKS